MCEKSTKIAIGDLSQESQLEFFQEIVVRRELIICPVSPASRSTSPISQGPTENPDQAVIGLCRKADGPGAQFHKETQVEIPNSSGYSVSFRLPVDPLYLVSLIFHT